MFRFILAKFWQNWSLKIAKSTGPNQKFFYSHLKVFESFAKRFHFMRKRQKKKPAFLSR